MIHRDKMTKEAMAAKLEIKGPAVDKLIQLVNDMFNIDDAREINNLGFNKFDRYDNTALKVVRNTPFGGAIPSLTVHKAMLSLDKYIRQFNEAGVDWKVLRQAVIDTYLRDAGYQGQLQGGEKKVELIGKGQYGKWIFVIPGVTFPLAKEMYKIIEATLKDWVLNGDEAQKRIAKPYLGKTPIFKVYEGNLSGYALHPLVMPVMANLLSSKGYDVSAMTKFSTSTPTSPDGAEEDLEAVLVGKGEIEIRVRYKDEAIREQIKTAPYYRFNGKNSTKKNNKWSIKANFDFWMNEQHGLVKMLSGAGYDVSELTKIVKEAISEQEEEKESNGKKTISFTNIYDKTSGVFHLAITPHNGSWMKEVSEFAKNCFPELILMYTEDGKLLQYAMDRLFLEPDNVDSKRRIDKFLREHKGRAYRIIDKQSPFIGMEVKKNMPWSIYITGTLSDYYGFEDVLNRFGGYNTLGLQEAISNLIDAGVVKIDKVDGLLDGYTKKNEGWRPENDIESFYEVLDSKTDPNIKLYPLQKEGVAFIYGRKSVVLGDETGGGKCVSADTLISTSEGIFAVSEIWENFSDKTKHENTSEEWRYPDRKLFINSIDDKGKVVKGEIANLYREKFKGKLRKIKTSNGKEIITSFPHKFLTPYGWTNKLKVGDIICSSSNQPHLGNKANKLDFDFVKFLAYQIAEGCETCKEKYQDVVQITQKDLNILEELKNIFDNKIKKRIQKKYNKNANCYLRQPKNERCSYISIASVWYRKYLESLGYLWGNKSRDKVIPDIILNATDESVKVFLRHFFDAEGYSCKSKRGIGVSSASQKLIFQLSILLQRFGILCTFRKMSKCATNGKQIKREYYELRIIGSGSHKFIKDIGFDYQYKQKAFTNISTKINYNKEGKPASIYLSSFMQRHNIPFRLLNIPSRHFISGKRGFNIETVDKVICGLIDLKEGKILKEYKKLKTSKWTKSTISTLESIDVSCLDNTIEDLKILRDNDLQYEKIVEIEIIDHDGYIYDLSVNKHHNFIAENLICHNTFSLISAANMRMDQDGGRTLIITLNATKLQWAKEIEKLTGETNISFNPTSGHKWTILYYPQFAAHWKTFDKATNTEVARREILARAIKEQGNFTCLILDECHNVKNDSVTTQMVQLATEDIPYKWGATATFAANKPIDGFNQLKTLGARLGDLSKDNYKQQFCGYKYKRNTSYRGKGRGGTKKRGRLQAANEQETLEAAANLRKWLTLSGTLIKRTKKDMNPDLPNHTSTVVPVQIDETFMEAKIAQIMKEKQYKDPSHVLSQLVAARMAYAKEKTKFSLELAMNVLNQDKKIIIFTCFNESMDILRQKLQDRFNKEGKGDMVVEYSGRTATEQRLANVEEFKKPDGVAKAMLISVLTGGTGLDLPNIVDTVIMNDRSWTPKDAEQSEGRAFRINSTNNVETINVVASGGFDEEMYDYVENKRKVSAMIGHLTSMENAYIMKKQKPPKDIHLQIIELQRKDKSFDANMMKYLQKFMGGSTIATGKGWYKKAGN